MVGFEKGIQLVINLLVIVIIIHHAKLQWWDNDRTCGLQ